MMIMMTTIITIAKTTVKKQSGGKQPREKQPQYSDHNKDGKEEKYKQKEKEFKVLKKSS